MDNQHVVAYFEYHSKKHGLHTFGGMSMYHLATRELFDARTHSMYGYLISPACDTDIPF